MLCAMLCTQMPVVLAGTCCLHMVCLNLVALLHCVCNARRKLHGPLFDAAMAHAAIICHATVCSCAHKGQQFSARAAPVCHVCQLQCGRQHRNTLSSYAAACTCAVFQQLEVDYYLTTPHHPDYDRNKDLKQVAVVRMFGVNEAGGCPHAQERNVPACCVG